MKKKILAFLLAALMVVSLLPTVAFATSHDLTVTKMDGDKVVSAIEGEDEESTGADYYWNNDELNILTNNLTISGSTATENIWVNDGVETLTLNGVTIAPTKKGMISSGIVSTSEQLTIILAGDNRIGNIVNKTAEMTNTDYFVQIGIQSPIGGFTFTGKGNLTIYDEEKGIYATDVVFDENFEGTLTIRDYGKNISLCAINASGDVKLLGGTFDLTSYTSDGIHASGNVTIDDATVTINSGREELVPGTGVGKNGIYVESGNVTISGKADVASGGHDYGIYVEEGTVRIGTADTDTIKVTADGYFGGIRVADGDIEINTGTIKARSHKWAIGVGKKESVEGDVIGSGNVTISGQNTKVVAFGGVDSPVATEEEYNYKWGCGIYALGETGGEKGAVTIKNGAGVIAKGYDYGIGAENKVSIQGAMTNVSAEGGYSVDVDPPFANNDEDDDVYAYGIFSNDKIVVMGGTVTAKGCDGAMNKDPILDYYQVLIDGVNTPSWRVLAGDDAEKAMQPEKDGWSENEYAEIFSMILKEKLDVDDSGKVIVGPNKVAATPAKLACYGITYDKEHRILTLDGLMQNMSAVELTVEDKNNAYAIRLPDGATLVLKGQNTIQAPHTSGTKNCGVLGIGALSIKSDKESGSLTLTAGNASTTKGKSFGIYSDGDLSIGGSVKLTVTAGESIVAYGISGAGNISITSGTISVKNGAAANTIAVAVGDGKTLTVGGTGKTAQLKNVKSGLKESVGIVEGGKLTAANGTYPLVISFDEGECVYPKAVKLTEDGEYGLKLNGCDKGEFTFAQVSGGWSIYNGEKFLAMENGKLALSTEPFAWTYKNGAFSANETVKTTKTTTNLLAWIFSFGKKSIKTTTTVTEIKTYYLSTVEAGEKLSTLFVGAELYTTVSGDHEFGCWIDCKDDMQHMRICKNCHEEIEYEEHDFGAEGIADKCEKCGAFNPACKSVDVSATYKTKTQKQYVGFWPFGYYKNVTTYTATVKTTVTGAKVTKVEVSANQNKGWIVSNTFTSNSEIEQFYVRITTSDGAKYLFRVVGGDGYPAN